MGRTSTFLFALFLALHIPLETAEASAARDAVFAELLQNPNDPDLMLRYARMAVQERDYESALATLERLVDLYPDAQEARFELAAAYFALGSDEAAEYHLNIYKERGELNAEESFLADRYGEEIEKRLSPVVIDGVLAAGALFRADTGEHGLTYDASLDISRTLEGARTTSWDTSLRLARIHYPGAPFNDSTRFALRSGIDLSTDNTSFGARLTPYLEYQHVKTDDERASSYGLGLAYSKPINETWGYFADVQWAHVDGDDGLSDATTIYGLAGITFQPTSDTFWRLSVSHFTDDSETGTDTEQVGIRLGVAKGLTAEFLGKSREMSLSGYLRHDESDYSDGVEDSLLSIGANFRTYLKRRTFVDLGVHSFRRSSSDATLDEEDSLLTLSAGWEF